MKKALLTVLMLTFATAGVAQIPAPTTPPVATDISTFIDALPRPTP